MNFLEFIASVLHAIAWPAAVAAILLRFRPELSAQLERITQVEVFGSKVALQGAIKEAKDNLPDQPEIDDASKREIPRLILDGQRPDEVILSSWDHLVEKFRAVAVRRDLRDRRGVFRDPRLIARSLPLPDDVQESLQSLRQVKDDIRGGNGLAYKPHDAVEYDQASKRVIAALGEA